MDVNNPSNREPTASRIDTSLRDTRHAAASWNVFAKSEIKWKQNGNKQPLSYAPGPPQVAPGFAVFCSVSLFAWRSRWRVPPLHSTQAELKAQDQILFPNGNKSDIQRRTATSATSSAWVVVIMRSMTYWHDGGGPGGLLGTFPQFLGRHRELATPSYMATLFSSTQHQMTTRVLLGPSSPVKKVVCVALKNPWHIEIVHWALAARF